MPELYLVWCCMRAVMSDFCVCLTEAVRVSCIRPGLAGTGGQLTRSGLITLGACPCCFLLFCAVGLVLLLPQRARTTPNSTVYRQLIYMCIRPLQQHTAQVAVLHGECVTQFCSEAESRSVLRTCSSAEEAAAGVGAAAAVT